MTFVHKSPGGSPTNSSDYNPSYSHREAGSGACDLNLGTTHAHNRSNVNVNREYFKIAGSHCRKFYINEPSADVW